MKIEWGTRLPNGNVCEWDSEAKARRAAEVSLTFPDGAHPLVARHVGEWFDVVTSRGLGDDPDGDLDEQFELMLTRKAHETINGLQSEVARLKAIVEAVEQQARLALISGNPLAYSLRGAIDRAALTTEARA